MVSKFVTNDLQLSLHFAEFISKRIAVCETEKGQAYITKTGAIDRISLTMSNRSIVYGTHSILKKTAKILEN